MTSRNTRDQQLEALSLSSGARSGLSQCPDSRLRPSHLDSEGVRADDFTIVCGWCGDVLVEGNDVVSHGCCEDCLTRLLREAQVATDLALLHVTAGGL